LDISVGNFGLPFKMISEVFLSVEPKLHYLHSDRNFRNLGVNVIFDFQPQVLKGKHAQDYVSEAPFLPDIFQCTTPKRRVPC